MSARRTRLASRSLLRVVLVAVWVSAAVPAASLPAAAAEPSATLTVFAAASLAEPFGELGRTLERSRPGLVVRFNFAGSQQLASQIEEGARVDLFASADDRWMSYLAERGRLSEDARTFARNGLVVIVPRTNPARIGRLQDLARRGVKLVVGAPAVPVGAYSREVLRRLAALPGFPPDFAARVLRNVVSEEENVKSVVAKVQIGEADAGIVYRSDVNPAAARHVRTFPLPDEANVVAEYPIALLRDAPDEPAARAFLALLASPEGAAVLARHQMTPVAAAAP